MTLSVDASNSTTGAGVIDSWHMVADSIGKVQNAHGADLAAVSVELGVNIASAVLDTVAFVMDPLAKLIAAGLGWLIEHVSFLRWPLDQVAGNPSEVTKLANELHKIGESLRMTATDLDAALKAQITKWEGAGHDSFVKSINDRRGWIDANAKAADVAGYMVETTGALISAVRSLLRDIITTVLGDIIATMLIALAMAAFTFGASIAVGVTKVVVTTCVKVSEMATKLTGLAAHGARTQSRLSQLAESVQPASRPGSAGHELDTLSSGSSSRPGSRPNSPGDEVDTVASGANNPVPNFSRPFGPDNPPPVNSQPRPNDGIGQAITTNEAVPAPAPGTAITTPSTHTTPEPPPRPSGPSSYLSKYDVDMIKKHEGWLKDKFGDSYAKMKWVDTWLKNKHPDYYPMLKALSDAKSSKNFVGWGGKSIVQIDRGLTDIQQQAEQAWQEEQQKQQQDQQQNTGAH
ncbi:hypothetical protein [Amycolatopsis sacchari]|uniref:hypothetical protein n=1 Tax=Amycolatopsis sacchari TaxID=115433 RepID=UPI003D759F6F